MMRREMYDESGYAYTVDDGRMDWLFVLTWAGMVLACGVAWGVGLYGLIRLLV
jgi:hypothetical protein